MLGPWSWLTSESFAMMANQDRTRLAFVTLGPCNGGLEQKAREERKENNKRDNEP